MEELDVASFAPGGFLWIEVAVALLLSWLFSFFIFFFHSDG